MVIINPIVVILNKIIYIKLKHHTNALIPTLTGEMSADGAKRLA
jgi:hypothetical protein